MNKTLSELLRQAEEIILTAFTEARERIHADENQRDTLPSEIYMMLSRRIENGLHLVYNYVLLHNEEVLRNSCTDDSCSSKARDFINKARDSIKGSELDDKDRGDSK